MPKNINKINKIIKARLKQFELLGKNGSVTFDFNPFINLKLKATVLTELLFCISTANSSAMSGILFQHAISKVLGKIKKQEQAKLGKILKNAMKKSAVRFYNKKTNYMLEAINKFEIINPAIEQVLSEPKQARDVRKVLVKTIKGISYKEASHFLRNIGVKDIAIIDRHVLKWLKDTKKISRLAKLNEKTYLKLEDKLKKIAEKTNCSVAELDLQIWYSATGLVLK